MRDWLLANQNCRQLKYRESAVLAKKNKTKFYYFELQTLQANTFQGRVQHSLRIEAFFMAETKSAQKAAVLQRDKHLLFDRHL